MRNVARGYVLTSPFLLLDAFVLAKSRPGNGTRRRRRRQRAKKALIPEPFNFRNNVQKWEASKVIVRALVACWGAYNHHVYYPITVLLLAADGSIYLCVLPPVLTTPRTDFTSSLCLGPARDNRTFTNNNSHKNNNPFSTVFIFFFLFVSSLMRMWVQYISFITTAKLTLYK